MCTRGNQSRGAMWLTAMMLALPLACVGEPCGAGAADVRGTVVDGSGAPVAGAVLSAGNATTKSGAGGEFVLPCVASDAVIRVVAASFAPAEVKADGITSAAQRVVLQQRGAYEEVSVTAFATPLAE